MKKIFFVIFMLCCMFEFAYARVNGELDIKGGILASPYLKAAGTVLDSDMGFTLGAEGYIFVSENLALGLGVSHLFDTDVENTAKKINYTDIFLSLKPRIPLNGDEIDYLYFIGQVGADSAEIKILDGNCDTGIYIAGGIGVEAGHLIMEFIYSYRYWSISSGSVDKASFYTLAFNIGCKFSI